MDSVYMLKGKFKCLTRLRCNIADEEDIQQAASVIMACVVLHNITRMPELYDYADRAVALDPLTRFPLDVYGDRRAAGATRRNGIMREVLLRTQ